MKLLRHVTPGCAGEAGCVATIGNFDGLHLGHQAVLRRVLEQAQAMGLPALLISFEPLPTEYFRVPPPPRIYGLRDKAMLLQELGVGRFICLRFDASLAGMEAEDFARHILLEGLRVRHLVIGDDFRFGKGRRGDAAMLQRLGQQHSMGVTTTPTVQAAATRVSSTRIRQALAAADLAAAADLLGRPYRISGRVRHGDKRGRLLGFPTLNLRVHPQLALKRGVYAVRVHGLAATPLAGVANLGTRPTVQGMELRLETHVFGFDQTVYGKAVSIEPVALVREEQRFPSLDALKAQIAADVAAAQSLLDYNAANSA